MSKQKLLCPVCRTELHVTHRGRYQDLSEHASNPNSEPSLKDGYQCTNFDWCEAANLKFTWINDGEYYFNSNVNVSWSEAHEILKSRSLSGMGYALNSWYHYYEKGKSEIAKRKRTIKVLGYKISFEPQMLGYSYPIEKQYMPSRFKWRYEIWKRDEERETYTSVTLLHVMVRYYLRSFKMSYRNLMKDPTNKRIMVECLEYIMGERWGRRDDRSFARVSSVLINLFHYRKCRKVLELSKINSR
jgi:hypothetical protein